MFFGAHSSEFTLIFFIDHLVITPIHQLVLAMQSLGLNFLFVLAFWFGIIVIFLGVYAPGGLASSYCPKKMHFWLTGSSELDTDVSTVFYPSVHVLRWPGNLSRVHPACCLMSAGFIFK